MDYLSPGTMVLCSTLLGIVAFFSSVVAQIEHHVSRVTEHAGHLA